MENSDKTPKVTGIGGIFFFSDDPKETRDWYAKNLGIDTTEWAPLSNQETIMTPTSLSLCNGVRSKPEAVIFLLLKRNL